MQFKKQFLLPLSLLSIPACLMLASSAATDRPGWVERYLNEPRPEWNEWQNSLAPKGEKARPLPLATDGETDYVIVIPAEATRQERRAASEVALWLEKITGANFPIVKDSEERRDREISVGSTNRVGSEETELLSKAGPDGYTIHVSDERLFLFGNHPSSPMNAAFALLEEDLGVRWYSEPMVPANNPAIGRTWTMVVNEQNEGLNADQWAEGFYRAPSHETLELSVVPRSVEPAFKMRQVRVLRAVSPWGLRNRINFGWANQYQQYYYINGSLTSHTFHWLVPPEKYFESNPEYYSLINGERRWRRAQLDLSNPEVAEIASRRAIEALKSAPPHRRFLEISAMDWRGHSEDEDSLRIMKELGSRSGLVLQFVNRIAERVAEEVPDATLTTLIYWDTNRPPAVDMEIPDNVVIRFAADWGANFSWPYHSFYDAKLSEDPEEINDRWVAQRPSFDRWKGMSERMWAWIYPHQYRHYPAPMPSLRPLAENLRFFAEEGVENAYIQGNEGYDHGRDAMRFWIYSKLLWDPTLDIEELMLDFIWGYYGDAAPDVVRYHELLWDHAVQHTDFSKRRDWIYAIHDEGMFQHGFVERAREILDHALRADDREEIRRRVEDLIFGVAYVDSVLLMAEMRRGETPPDRDRYKKVGQEVRDLARRLDVDVIRFYDEFESLLATTEDYLAEYERVARVRLDENFLDRTAWEPWVFRKDPDNIGLEAEWFTMADEAATSWTEVEVPAFLSETEIGRYLGYGWYRTGFTLTEEQAERPVEIQFDGVDEQAWIFVNGRYTGEHTLESEFLEGDDITVHDLWNRPFAIKVPAEQLKPGQNSLFVRMHASENNSGIHQPVRIYLGE